ncbi:DUF29 family protein [Nostoc commune]|uniref:DUF29 family protein n=1 Tax=Nostoc commune TaxID=1178 RepID=UPI001E2DD44D|nr:DUF29 family protein [Nostoc commune]
MSSLKAHSQTLYDTDYLQWIETTVEKLQSHDYAKVDWEILIEEIADIGRSERRSLNKLYVPLRSLYSYTSLILYC